MAASNMSTLKRQHQETLEAKSMKWNLKSNSKFYTKIVKTVKTVKKSHFMIHFISLIIIN